MVMGSATNPGAETKRASIYDEVRPLIDLCKKGKIFEVVEWIAQGRPINPPVPPAKGHRPKTPLELAMEMGIHSLVKILLESGAVDEADRYRPLIYHAIEKRRLDLIELFAANGFDPAAIDMSDVLHSWDPRIMEYFVERGASLETGQPLAWAFCDRIRTALKLYKSHVDQIPSLREQANIALRHHCKEGNLKWIALLLWAGADPYSPGEDTPQDEPSNEEDGLCALGYAALHNHYEVFKLKNVKLDPTHPQMVKLIRYLHEGEGIEILQKLLKLGLNPNDEENGGCSAISSMIWYMGWWFPSYWGQAEEKNLDRQRDRDALKAVHILALHGAKWIPSASQVNDARRTLLKLKPDYVAELAWIMAKYRACSLDVIKRLLGTPTMKRHVGGNGRLQAIIEDWRKESAGLP
jgi:hypothetical protein